MTRIGQVFAYALLFLFAGTAWSTPLTELVDRYGLSGGLIQVTPEATVEMPDGVLTARFELFRFAPSPYEMTLHLEYRDGSLGKPALATGWRLEGIPSDGLVAGWHVQWDRNGRVTSRSDDSGNHIDYSYDDKGQLIEVINQAGQGWRFDYGSDGSINRITGTDEREFNVVRNPQRLLTEITTHQGTWRFEYDDNQHIKRFQNPGGRWIELTLDEKGRVTGVAGRERYSFSYQASAKALEVVMRKGIEPTRTFRFDPAYRWTSSSIENGPTVTSQMSNKGELTEISDSSGRAERYEYDRRMRLTRVTGSDGATTTIDNGRHGPKRITGPTGLVTEINYDRLGREISTREENRETLSRYDRSGRLSQVTNPDGGSERYRYSLEGHRIETVGVDQQSLTSSYDDKGRQSRITKGGVNTEIRHYVDDRLESVTVNGTTFTRYEYDPAGQLKRIENEGVSRRYTWDDSERLVEILEGENSRLSLQYDQSGQLSQLQLADGTPSQFWYNRQGLIELKDLGVTQKSFRYDPVGRISEIRNGRGQQINYAYDPADRLSSVTTSDGTRISLEYDPGGETQRISTETADQTIGRDRFGNPVNISDSQFSEPVKLEFDASDRISSIHFGDNNTTRYQHESSGLLKSIQLPWGGSIGFDNLDGKRSLTRLPNGATVEYARDSAGRLNGMTLRGPDGQQLDSIGYGFDSYGRVTGEQGKWQVKRDKRGQISQFAPQSGKTESYRYDPRGNLLSAADGRYEYDKLNRLTRSPGSTYVYDADGNLERLGGQRQLKYEWDALNRLTAILGSPFGDVHYGYDALGRRVSKRINESEVRYFWLDDRILLHADNSGQPVRQLIHGQRVDEVVAINIAGEPFYPVQDGLGDIRWLLDKTGKLIATFRFDPWGNLVEGSPEWLARLELGYRGRDYDVESGLYYMRARYYSPIMKRFVSVDPEDGELERPRSFNPYLYALNAPLDFVDPYGTSAETPLDWAGRQIGEATYGVYRGFRWAGGKAYNAAHAVFQPLVAIKQGKFTEKYISKPAEKLRDGAMQSLERGLDAGGAFTTYREGIEDDPRRLETVGADAQRRLQRLQGVVKYAGGRFSAPVQSIYEAAAIASNPNEQEALQQAAAWVMKNTEAMAQALINIPKNATQAEIKNAILGAIKNNPRIRDRLGNLGDKSGFLVDKALDKFADKMAGEIIKHPTKPIEDAIKGQKTPQNVQHMKQAYDQLERELNGVVSAKKRAAQAAMDSIKSAAERARGLATKVAAAAAKVKAAAALHGKLSGLCNEVKAAVDRANTAADNAERYEKQVARGISGAQALAANCKDAKTANKISELYNLSQKLAAGIGVQAAKASVAADTAASKLSEIRAAKTKIDAARALLPQITSDTAAAEDASKQAVQAEKTAKSLLKAFNDAANALVGRIDRVAKGVPDDRKVLKNQFKGLLSRTQAMLNSVQDTSATNLSAARVAYNDAVTAKSKATLPEGDVDCAHSVPNDAVSRADSAYTGALISVGAGATLSQSAANCLTAAQGGGQQSGSGQQSGGQQSSSSQGGNTGQSSGGQQGGGTSGQTDGNQGQSGGDSGDSGGDDFDDFDASTDPGMGSGPTGQQIAQTSQTGDQFQTGVPGDGSSSGGRPQGGQTGQQIGSSYTDPGTPIGGSGTGDTATGATSGTAGTGSTGTQTAGTGGPAGQQAGDDWDNYITSGPQISSAGATGTTGSTAGTTGTGSGTSSGSGTSTGGGQYIAACNRGDGKIVVTKSFSTSNHISMSSGFASEQEAITWVTNSCSTWRCNKSSGACDTNPGDSTGVGTYSTGDVTSTFGSVWKRVGCSLGGPHICWGSGGRTMADGDGDGRTDILLGRSVHWKNVGGSSSPITK
ncbi:MAG: RHS repeat-associated core domain-containing protein [Sedimenticola sp.]